MSLLDTASLLLTPNAYKEGKLYSVIPSDGSGDFTFTRATTATRVNSDGLVELVPYNLLQQSNTFNNAIWQLIGTPTITANYDTNPLTGENDAWRFQSSGISQRIYQALNNSFCTFSLYAKGSGNIRIQDNSSTYYTTLTLTSSWQRFLIYIPASFTNVQILSSPGGCDATIYGAQVVEGTEALPYLKTETRLNRPRVDFSLPGCPNLLLEPQRTNLALRSEEFDNATIWTTNINGTGVNPIRTANSVISPSGVQNADTILFNRGAGNTINDRCVINQFITVATTGTYYFSCWMKATTSGDIGKQVFMRCGSSGSLQAFTLTANWVRYETTATVTSGSNQFEIGNRGTFTTPNSVSVDLWGAQLEVGSYSTSYIPTTTASVTRNADVCVGAGNTATFNSTEGVLYVELSSNSIATFKNMSINSDGSNRINFFIYNSAVTANFDVGGVNQASISYTIPSVTSFNKFAFSYKLNEFKLFVNGTQRGSTDTSGIVPPINTFNKFSFNDSFANNFYGNVKDLQIFTTALTDDQLEALTGEGFNTYAEMASYYNYTLQ